MYEFAANKEKLQRAIVLAGPEAGEDAVREAYVKLGGLVIEDFAAKREEVPAPKALKKK